MSIDAIKIWLSMTYMNATLVLDHKFTFKDGSLFEIRLWQVPKPVPPSTHGLKYRMVYVVKGERVIGYDNERGKGDHRHLHGVEMPYEFVSIEKLLADFRADIEAERGGPI